MTAARPVVFGQHIVSDERQAPSRTLRSSASSAPSDPGAWVTQHGDALYRYALLHLSDPSAAEDAVQETLLAAWQARRSFAGQSSERTWLIGILKRKIVDHCRAAAKTTSVSDLETTADLLPAFFTARGKWRHPPQQWSVEPSQSFEHAEFWDVLTFCLSLLPPRLRVAFVGRELSERDNEELCQLLEVTATNLWTLLHRARTRLRACLEANWFGEEP
jgi:RNA polymerase sigma-70 factor (TIGR02943 family)